MPLQKCIEDYLSGTDTAIAAYVVKELGNNSTHYPIDPDHPFVFSEQKEFLDMFLYIMAGKLKVRNVRAALDARKAEKLGEAMALAEQDNQ
jgi:hypothetical protein